MRKLSLTISVAVLLVVACGFMLWAGTSAVERDLFVPIAMTGLTQGLTLEGNPPKGIEIRVQGPVKVLDKFRDQSQLVYPLDLSGLAPGEHALTLEGQCLILPRRVKVKNLRPATITLRVAPEIRKELPVRITYLGTPAPGFYATKTEISPGTVELRGPARRLANMHAVETKPIDIAAASADVVKQVSLALPPDVVLPEEQTMLVATVRVSTRTVVRQFNAIPVVGRSTTHGFTIHPTNIALEVKGPSDLLEGPRAADEIKAYVDLEGLEPGVYVRRASIVLPLAACLVGDVDPELFTVQIGGPPGDNLTN